MHTVNENYKAISLLRPQVATSTATGTGVDVSEYGDDAMAILDVGAVSGTTPTLDVVIQTSATVGGTYSTELTFAQVTAANKFAAGRVNLDGPNSGGLARKFVRALATIAGTTPSFTFGVSLLVRAAIGKTALNSATPA